MTITRMFCPSLSILEILARASDGTAFHLYGGDASLLAQVHDAYPNKSLYLTEQSVN